MLGIKHSAGFNNCKSAEYVSRKVNAKKTQKPQRAELQIFNGFAFFAYGFVSFA